MAGTCLAPHLADGTWQMGLKVETLTWGNYPGSRESLAEALSQLGLRHEPDKGELQST